MQQGHHLSQRLVWSTNVREEDEMKRNESVASHSCRSTPYFPNDPSIAALSVRNTSEYNCTEILLCREGGWVGVGGVPTGAPLFLLVL